MWRFLLTQRKAEGHREKQRDMREKRVKRRISLMREMRKRISCG